MYEGKVPVSWVDLSPEINGANARYSRRKCRKKEILLLPSTDHPMTQSQG
jgi:hypothetical protein